MNRRKPFGLILAAFFGYFSPPVNAQFNLKAGYNISIVSDPGINDVIADFARTQPYTSSFSKFSWLHGFEAGLRFKSDVHAFEMTYQNGYQRLKADGDTNGGSEPYSDEISIAIHSGAVGYQVTGEVFGAGTDLQYQWYRTKVDLAQAESVFRDIQEMYALKFYLMLTLKGSGGVDAAVQPYYVLPFDAYDTDPLSLYLNQVPGPEGKKWTRFGLTLLFYNGGK
jgi:hypothetical protein